VHLAHVGERLEGGHPHQAFRRLHAERPVLGDPPGKLQGPVQHLARRRDRVDEAESEGFGRRDGVAGHRHFQCLGQRDPACEVHAAAGREQAALGFGQPELGVFRDYGEVASEHHLEPAGHRGRLDGADHRLVAAAAAGCKAAKRFEAAELFLGRRDLVCREGPQVHPGAERPVAGPGQYDGTDTRVGVGGQQRGADAGHHRDVERVARGWPVDADDEHVAAPLEDDLRLRVVAGLLGFLGGHQAAERSRTWIAQA
jgi:hypothetical protein